MKWLIIFSIMSYIDLKPLHIFANTQYVSSQITLVICISLQN